MTLEERADRWLVRQLGVLAPADHIKDLSTEFMAIQDEAYQLAAEVADSHDYWCMNARGDHDGCSDNIAGRIRGLASPQAPSKEGQEL